jgi:putative endonuclease
MSKREKFKDLPVHPAPYTKFMFYVYLLKSKKDKKCYIGSTNDLKRRFKEHNTGEVFSTKSRRPLSLIYYESFRSEKDARLREKKLKNYGKVITELYKRLRYSLNE